MILLEKKSSTRALLKAESFYTYEQYRALTAEQATRSIEGLEGEELLHARYVPLNLQRMKRMEKTVMLNPELQKEISKIEIPLDWYVLAEPWCGDGAQNIPVLEKIAAQNPNIRLRIVLRDSNLSLMDQYLNDGKRCIPKLICFERTTGRELGTWGPRPKNLEKELSFYKAQNPDISKDETLAFVHKWYAQDKGKGLQEDILAKIKTWH